MNEITKEAGVREEPSRVRSKQKIETIETAETERKMWRACVHLSSIERERERGQSDKEIAQ